MQLEVGSVRRQELKPWDVAKLRDCATGWRLTAFRRFSCRKNLS